MRFLSYCDLSQQSRSHRARFGQGLKPIEAIARTLA
jgi:hypothetical protein